MQLYLIRHGQSVNNALWVSNGSSEGREEDPGLTQTGRRQAEHAAAFLARGNGGARPKRPVRYGTNAHGFDLTHLYCSLMLRGVETGTIIAEKTGTPLLGWTDIHECGGIYVEDEDTGARIGRPGKTRSFFASSYPSLVVPETVGEDGWWNRPFEDEGQRIARASRVAEQLRSKHGKTRHRVGMVTHGEFYSRLLVRLLGIPPTAKLWFTLNNLGITRLDISEEYTNVVYLNRIEFLPEELVT